MISQNKTLLQQPSTILSKKNSNRTYYSTNPKRLHYFFPGKSLPKIITIQILASTLIPTQSKKAETTLQPTPTPIPPHQKWTSIPRAIQVSRPTKVLPKSCSSRMAQAMPLGGRKGSSWKVAGWCLTVGW